MTTIATVLSNIEAVKAQLADETRLAESDLAALINMIHATRDTINTALDQLASGIRGSYADRAKALDAAIGGESEPVRLAAE